MIASDGSLWCETCKCKIFRSPIISYGMYFCNDICRDIFEDEHKRR